MKLLTKGLLAGALMAAAGTAYAECMGDFDCSMGQQCVKPAGSMQTNGNCVTPTDGYGNQRPDYSMNSDVREAPSCRWDTDCGPGLSCMKRAGQQTGTCVK